MKGYETRVSPTELPLMSCSVLKIFSKEESDRRKDYKPDNKRLMMGSKYIKKLTRKVNTKHHKHESFDEIQNCNKHNKENMFEQLISSA